MDRASAVDGPIAAPPAPEEEGSAPAGRLEDDAYHEGIDEEEEEPLELPPDEFGDDPFDNSADEAPVAAEPPPHGEGAADPLAALVAAAGMAVGLAPELELDAAAGSAAASCKGMSFVA